MSLTVALNSATSGLRALTEALATTSNNINNANTTGYNRRVANFETYNTGNVTNGSHIKSVTRQVEANLVRQANAASGTLASTEILKTYTGQVAGLFGQPGDGGTLARQISDLSRSFEDLAGAPQSGPVQTALVLNARQIAGDFADVAGSIQEMRRDVDAEIGKTLTAINDRLKQLEEFNVSLANSDGGNLTLLDKRDSVISELSQMIGIKTFERSNGEITVIADSGLVLLDKHARQFDSYSPRPNVSAQTQYGATAGGFDSINLTGDANDFTVSISGGKLESLIRLRDNTLPGYQRQVDQLAGALRDKVNQAHNRGTALPPPNSLTSGQVLASGTRIAFGAAADKVVFAVLDPNGKQVASYTLTTPTVPDTIDNVTAAINTGLGASGSATFDAATGRFTIKATNAANGVAVVDGAAPSDVAITYTPPGAGAVPLRAAGFSSLLGLNDFFKSAEPNPKYTSALMGPNQNQTASFTVMTAPAGTVHTFAATTGTPQEIVAAINAASLGGVTASLYRDGDRVGIHLSGPANFRIGTAAADTYGFVQAHNGAADTLGVRSDIAADPAQVARGRLRAVDLNNDGTIDSYNVGLTDNAAIQGVAAAMVTRHNFNAGGGLAASNLSLGDYAGAIIDHAAREADRMEQQQTFQQDVVSEIKGRIGAVSEVDIDAELARLISLQNSYAATARVISTVNSLFDVLERAV